jgi:predicted nucleic acid-binding protein
LERIVIDASVATKWFIPERNSDRALRLRGLCLDGTLEIMAPTLIYYEVANALRFHPYHRLSEVELLKAITALKNMQIAVEPAVKTWSKAFEISIINDISIYDAIYLATSLSFGAKLITSDREMFRRLSNSMRDNVSLLEELDF